MNTTEPGKQIRGNSTTGFKDSAEKVYFRDPKHLADLVNGEIFDGRQVVQAEDFEETDSEEILADLVNNKTLAKDAYRDGLNLVSANTVRGRFKLYLFGRENQTFVHFAMPVKVMLSDSLNFTDQAAKIAKKHRKKDRTAGKRVPSDEFLSGFGRDDHILPVITIVIYWNAGPWYGPRRLSDMYDKTLLPKEILAYAPDYPIHVLVPHDIDPDKFHTSLKYLFMACRVIGDPDRLHELFRTDPAYQNLDRDAAVVLRAITGMRIRVPKKKEKINMNKAFEDWARKRRAEGNTEGNLNSIFKYTADGTLPLARAVNDAKSYGVKDEKDFRNKAKTFGYRIP